MSVAPFRCEVEPDRDAARVVPYGELDAAAVGIVEAELTVLRERGFRRLILDLRHVSFLDLAGLRLVLRWSAAPSLDGLVAFGVIQGPAPMRRLFDVTHTASQVTFVDHGGRRVQPPAARPLPGRARDGADGRPRRFHRLALS